MGAGVASRQGIQAAPAPLACQFPYHGTTAVHGLARLVALDVEEDAELMAIRLERGAPAREQGVGFTQQIEAREGHGVDL